MVPPRWLVPIAPILLLLILFWAQLSTLPYTSPTYDEHEYLARGYTYLQTGDTSLKLRHPILLDNLAALPLQMLPNVQLPPGNPGLAEGNFHLYAYAFFWQTNEASVDQMIFLARLPSLAFSMLLAAAAFRWAKAQFGRRAALLTLALATFDPNLLAHGRLVTPDVGQTTLIFLATFCWWRYLQRRSWPRLLLAGLVLGLAQTAGFPALILYPVWLLVTLLYVGRRWKTAVFPLIAAALLSLLVIWAVYGFTWGPVWPGGIPLPAPYHWQEFLALLKRLDRTDMAYLHGELYRGGRWQFFVIALLIKTPLPTLLLLGAGIVFLLRRRRWGSEAALWLLPAVYYANALISDLNIGYRHILPVLPFIWLLAGSSVVLLRQRWQKVAVAGLTGWLIVAALWLHPSYLAYFNELVGGPQNGRFWLTVSDLDWGQDLPGLAAYRQTHADQPLFLSWFGTADPQHYGLNYHPLPAWPPRGTPGREWFHPDYPLPGLYAISAANLMGARFEQNSQTFAWFWDKSPLGQIGYSVWLYKVPRLLDPAAPTANVVLHEATLPDLPAATVETRLHTNDMVPRWVNGERGFVVPNGRSFYLINPQKPLHPLLQNQLLAALPAPTPLTSQQGEPLLLYEGDLAPVVQNWLATTAVSHPYSQSEQPLEMPVAVGTAVSLLGTSLSRDGQTLTLLSIWQIHEAVDYPLTFFTHLLAPDGSIVAQFDGLDVSTSQWQPGDYLLQIHPLSLPETIPAGTRWLSLGLYRPDTFARLSLVNGTGEAILLSLQ